MLSTSKDVPGWSAAETDCNNGKHLRPNAAGVRLHPHCKQSIQRNDLHSSRCRMPAVTYDGHDRRAPVHSTLQCEVLVILEYDFESLRVTYSCPHSESAKVTLPCFSGYCAHLWPIILHPFSIIFGESSKSSCKKYPRLSVSRNQSTFEPSNQMYDV
jgi:hypothetical protein